MKAVFVCTGNTCRSFMAEALARSAAGDYGLTGWEFQSAGLWAAEGSPASEHSLSVLREIGIEADSHRSRMLSRDIVEGVDLVLTMTQSHRRQVLDKFPELKDKTYTLFEYAHGSDAEINDPFGGSIYEYRQSMEQINTAIKALIRRLAKEE